MTCRRSRRPFLWRPREHSAWSCSNRHRTSSHGACRLTTQHPYRSNNPSLILDNPMELSPITSHWFEAHRKSFVRGPVKESYNLSLSCRTIYRPSKRTASLYDFWTFNLSQYVTSNYSLQLICQPEVVGHTVPRPRVGRFFTERKGCRKLNSLIMVTFQAWWMVVPAIKGKRAGPLQGQNAYMAGNAWFFLLYGDVAFVPLFSPLPHDAQIISQHWLKLVPLASYPFLFPF